MKKKIKGIGGTDISAILGMNPYKTPLDVWLDKTGQGPPDEDDENKWWGREMEPVLAKRYIKECEQKFGSPFDLVIPSPVMLPIRHKKIECVVGSPDALWLPTFKEIKKPGIVTVESQGGVDFKTSGRPQDWGEPGTDDIPRHYHLQADWYMGLTGAAWWDVATLLMSFNRRFMIFRVTRDDDLIGYLQEEAEKFWKDHVLSGIPPDLDGSKSAGEYIKRKYPVEVGPMLAPTDTEILADIDRYRENRDQLKHLEQLVSMYENRLKNFVGDCAGMEGGWGRITWRKSKDSPTVDWKGLAISFNPDLDQMNKFTSIKQGTRRWLPKFTKEED